MCVTMVCSAMDERRKSPRVRAFKGARIIYNNGATTRDCTIRNLSSGGAKLVMESTVGLPGRFVLAFEDGSRRQCVIRWRRLNELGVEFAPHPSGDRLSSHERLKF